jgi:uncharacterized protein YheU (UPF0270 family)
VAPDDLEPDLLREGTDDGVHETSLEAKVAQVLIQLRRGEVHITFGLATESVNVVVTSAIGGSGRPYFHRLPAHSSILEAPQFLLPVLNRSAPFRRHPVDGGGFAAVHRLRRLCQVAT